jgi:nitrile hydratase
MPDGSNPEAHPIKEQTVEDPQARARALQSLLIEEGLVSTDAIDEVVELFEEDIGPLNGAKVVARAWTDPDYRGRLLSDSTAAIDELGFEAGGKPITVVENTPEQHNVLVCTLCSCYPWPLLGLPPSWYKSEPYRSRMVREPRAVLAEFGLEIDEDREIRVWDQTSELRYMVLPQRPPGTDDLSEAELAELVTRDSMVGVEKVAYEGRTA